MFKLLKKLMIPGKRYIAARLGGLVFYIESWPGELFDELDTGYRYFFAAPVARKLGSRFCKLNRTAASDFDAIFVFLYE